MTIEFKLPELGENIESGDVVNVLVHEGDLIHGNQGVLELETDKAVVELPCPHAGKVVKVHVTKGETVKVGQTLLSIETEAGAEATAKPAGKEPETGKEKKAETGKGERETAGEGPVAADRAKPQAAAAGSPHPSPLPEGEGTGGAPLPAGPAARRLARELGVDLRQVQGTGSRGRITPEDVQAAAGAPAAGPMAAAASGAGVPEPVVPPGEPGQDAWGPVRRQRMSKIRRTIAAQMVKSATAIPHVTNFDDADVTELEQLRKGIPKGYLGANVKLTAMPFVMKAVAVALRHHPLLNASLEEDDQVVYKEYVHLGVAVDTPRGLVVPVVRNVDRMTVPEIARALVTVAERARAVQFTVEDLRGGTFTISNLGAVGGTYSTPIINHPEAALLLLGRSRWMPVVRGENIEIEKRLMMPLSLSYDHRLVDGAAAARFLNEVIELLQSPGKLLLAG